MSGLFDPILRGAPRQTPATRAPEGGPVPGATPEQIREAIKRLNAQGIMNPTKTDIAEMVALMAGEPAEPQQKTPAQKPPAQQDQNRPGRPVLGGPQPSPELLERLRQQQEERNRLILEEALRRRRAMSGARD